MTKNDQEHPFAKYIRILGKGKKGSRSLTQEEAYSAMTMIMEGKVEPVQLGAFLMLMRVKEESAEELAGFVKASRDSFEQPDQSITVDLDWSSYAGKRRHLPWFLLSALLLANNNFLVFMHGTSGHSANRIYTEDILPLFDIKPATSYEESARQMKQSCFSYLSLKYFCPKLFEMIELRQLMGLRSPVHTLARMLNPFHARTSIQGIFHPGYRPVHQQAALLLGDNITVFRGEGGEAERNPDVDCLVQSVESGIIIDEQWPALFKRRHIKPDHLEPSDLLSLWQGTKEDEYGESAIISTTAIALKALGKADNQEQALDLASQFWQARPKQKYSKVS